MANLFEKLQEEIERVRVLQKIYKEIGPSGVIGNALMEAAIVKAKQAIGSGDPIMLIAAIKRLEDFTE